MHSAHRRALCLGVLFVATACASRGDRSLPTVVSDTALPVGDASALGSGAEPPSHPTSPAESGEPGSALAASAALGGAEPTTAPREAGHTEWLEAKGNRIRFYGFPRVDTIITDSKLAPNNQSTLFVVSEDPSVQADGDEAIDIHPRATRLGVDIERDEIPMIPTAKLSGKIELDFQNGGSESRPAVRMRHGYLQVKDESGLRLLAGQTWDVISPLLPAANADTLMWNTGNLGDRRPQLRLGYDAKIGSEDDESKVSFDLALARTGAINNRDLDGDGTADGVDSGAPMVQARVGVADLVGGRIAGGVWGHIAWEEAGPMSFHGHSVGCDLQAKITEELTLLGEVFYGENLDDVRGGIGQGIDTTTAQEIASRGFWAEARYRVNGWYTPAVGYGIDDPHDSDLDPTTTSGGGPRRRNQAAWLANHFDLGGGLGVGLEYIYWLTSYVALADGDAHRVNLWLAYKF